MDKHDMEDNSVSLSTHPGKTQLSELFFFPTVKKNLKESKIRN